MIKTKLTYSLRFVAPLCILPFLAFSTQVSNAQGGFIGGMAEAWSKQLERDSIREQALKDQKELMEYQYKLDAERQERQMRREAEQRESSRRAETARLEEQRRQQRIAEEKKTQDEATQRRNATVTGTGFFITSNGYLVTNHHVVEDKTHYAVRDQQGSFYRAEVVAQDANRDLAILRVAGKFPSLRIARSESVTKGQRVMTVGYPQVSIQGNESKVTDGVISSFSGMNNDANWFQISTPIQGGNSGGPLVTETGQVVGVVVATANAMRFFKNTGNIPQNVNYAIKSNVLLGFLTEQNIANTPTTASKATMEAVDQATVLVIAKNSPIDVSFTVSPELRREQERERLRLAAETEKQRRNNEISERQQAAEKERQQRLAEKEQKIEQDKLAKELAEIQAKIFRRDQQISMKFPEWPKVQESALFVQWIELQNEKIQQSLVQGKTLGIIEVLQKFQAEKDAFKIDMAQQEVLASLTSGISYFNVKRYRNALDILEPLAKNGSAQAQRIVARIYLAGLGVQKNPALAVQYAKPVSEILTPTEQLELATILRLNAGVPVNLIEAFKWLNLSAKGGNATAQNNLGVAYQVGDGTEINYAEAKKWFELAESNGSATAKNNLILLLSREKSKSRPDALAVENEGGVKTCTDCPKAMAIHNGGGPVDVSYEPWYVQRAEQEKTHLDTITSSKLNQNTAHSQTVSKTPHLDSEHPGWVALVRTEEFRDWLKSQPQNVKQLASSDNEFDAIRLIIFFKGR